MLIISGVVQARNSVVETSNKAVSLNVPIGAGRAG